MSFLSVLGKIGKFALPFVPGIGPVASAALDIGGKVAGGMSKQRAEDRGAQGEYDAMRVPIENSQAMQHAQMRRQAEADRLRQISGAEMLQNFKGPTDPRAQKYLGAGGQLSGGQISPETLAMMRERSMNALQSGSDVPQLQTMPQKPGGGATGMDSFLNALSMGGTALGALRESGVLRGDDGGQQTSVNAPGDLSASIFRNRPEEDAPWWSPLRRGN